ncbi:PstS family phosphate ABC transporter substrate-binding protein [Rhodococcus triatomae]|uniref:Phosphate transport system substrate-binding protein n=1 Tax=Rhodococcus triatomae TaxID=300028 RepID=A0A1G8H351_9NOCA|nr:PstS family phosphate ABC transporter substrate-binding protein [Rhodococcus triatomae]QNG20223.1 PstS family phosphate ABC transporter substrate-binding protein [Rhodococcus triatomae]QNG23862.1 PstS family phosphate ABC transporter substrate-binding protein [Rhodococcus triatomae]SDI00989.1 phosphate transport system substrate-binding protein [Rhodococcus triatomae]
MRERLRGTAIVAAAALTASLAACGGNGESTPIEISGSATVAPVTAAIARDGRFAVDIAAEGTLAGFERFCAGETAINNASEAIPGAGQRIDFVQMCADNGVEFIELPIALDALSLVRNENNSFASDLTFDELSRIWSPDSDVQTWQDVREEWPDRQISLFGRPEGSATFEYFTHFVTGEAGRIRSDYRATDDMAELAGWVAEDDDSLGFMGVGNYLAADEEYRDRISNVAIDGVTPSRENAQSGRYTPLTRPLFLYVSTDMLDDPNVAEFVEYYIDTVNEMLPRVYFYALPDAAYPLVRQRFDDRVTGTMFGGDPFSDLPVVDALGSPPSR